jgi:hypothetical protein
MGCKAQFAANSPAIGKNCNAADRPSLRMRGPGRVMQRFLKKHAAIIGARIRPARWPDNRRMHAVAAAAERCFEYYDYDSYLRPFHKG